MAKLFEYRTPNIDAFKETYRQYGDVYRTLENINKESMKVSNETLYERFEL